MSNPTYGQWFRDMVRTESATLRKSKYWSNMSPLDRFSWLLERMCRRCGMTKKELLGLLQAEGES